MDTKIIVLFILTAMASTFTIVNCTEKNVKVEDSIVKVDEFQKYIDTVGLKFTMPPNFEETYVKRNKDLNYTFAIQNKKEKFEVRYTVLPLKPLIDSYNKNKLDKTVMILSPNVIYTANVQANVFNMTGGQSPGIKSFSTKGVQKTFNADAGGSSSFEFNCEFGKGYKYGQMIYLHKDNVADVIITYMSNDRLILSALLDKSFLALQFK